MIYFLTFFLSLFRSLQEVASSLAATNIRNMEKGRTPNATISIFPVVPIVQFLAVGGAYFLEVIVPAFAIWIVIGYYFISMLLWVRSYRELSIHLDAMQKDPYRHQRKKNILKK